MMAATCPIPLYRPAAAEYARPMVTETIPEDARWRSVGLETLSARATTGALCALGLDPARFEICVLGCDDTRMTKLNAAFRGKPHPTNVLSWPSGHPETRAGGETGETPTALGDIAIAYDTCAREAAQNGTAIADHVTHLIVHGTLHLLGYDHINDTDAATMEALEIKILGKLGISNPYEG